MSASPIEIEAALQRELERQGLGEASAVEAARWLDRAALLVDSADRPGRPLRDLLRAGKIPSAKREPNGRWFVYRRQP